MSLPRRLAPVLFAPLILLACLATVAHADAVPADAPTLIKGLDAAAKRGGLDVLRPALDATIAALEGELDDADRARLLASIGKLLRSKDEEVQRAALTAFATIGDANAWRYYGSLLRRPVGKRFSPLQSAAMDVTRTLKPEGAVKPLLRIVRKSKHLGAAAKAVATLGAYGKSRQRVKILDALVTAVKKEQPGVRGREQDVVYGPRVTGEQARNRWEALSGPMVDAANRMTGLDFSGPDEWFQVWQENRRKLDGLFDNDA